jgi:hypothetical protein
MDKYITADETFEIIDSLFTLGVWDFVGFSKTGAEAYLDREQIDFEAGISHSALTRLAMRALNGKSNESRRT